MTTPDQLLISRDSISDDALADIVGREAALWIDRSCLVDADSLDAIKGLLSLPWRLVLCELTSQELFQAIQEKTADQSSLVRLRGFLYPIAADPTGISLPARALPIFFLNGIDTPANAAESSALRGLGASRRRLNMIAQLATAGPKRLVVLGDDVKEQISALSDLWLSEFRALLTFVASPSRAEHLERELQSDLAAVPLKTLIRRAPLEFIGELIRKVESLLPDTSLQVRVLGQDNELRAIDITGAELIEQPLLDSYELIEHRHILTLTPSDLSKEDFLGFFEKRQNSWRPFAAGLPWIRESAALRRLMRALEEVREAGSDQNTILRIVSQPGAGGTTLMRQLAYEAAKSGYPTLVAKPHLSTPSATEVASFLYRAISVMPQRESTPSESRVDEIPWLIAFDAENWPSLEHGSVEFLAELARSGRSAVVLVVQSDDSTYSRESDSIAEIASLTHELDSDDVEKLGRHLNNYLTHLRFAKPLEDWRDFWMQHRPDVDTPIAAFWIALEFWLKGLLNLGESIQDWLLRQFKSDSLSDPARLLVLELAVLAIERRAIPEILLPKPSDDPLPLSVLLSRIRRSVPGLAILQYESPIGRIWAVAHDVLGRYLLNAVYHDRPLATRLGLQHYQSPVELRLDILRAVAARAELGQRHLLPYAVQFATRTLKLDFEGNAEFFPQWRTVLKILESVPVTVRKTSRTFNHHVAISRRRVAKVELFGATTSERREQLTRAISDLEFALGALERIPEDESDMNLYNSLALAYQDFAELELSAGAKPEVVSALRLKASEATRNALKENPSNSYVLETAARNLLQQAKLDAASAVESAAEALGYVFRASALDTSIVRQNALRRLVESAQSILSTKDAASQIDDLCRQGNPFGFLARAWSVLLAQKQDSDGTLYSSFAKPAVAEAVKVLAEAPNHWLLLSLQYELETNLNEYNFEQQLALLELLDSFPSFNLPIQQQLERCILLHMTGRHQDANRAFQQLRPLVRQSSAIVYVPDRLKWLLSSDRKARLLCTARIVDDAGFRATARIYELSNASVPFIPQQFGSLRVNPGATFRCHISFGAMGPFARPPYKGPEQTAR
jgi:hypothetical protein